MLFYMMQIARPTSLVSSNDFGDIIIPCKTKRALRLRRPTVARRLTI